MERRQSHRGQPAAMGPAPRRVPRPEEATLRAADSSPASGGALSRLRNVQTNSPGNGTPSYGPELGLIRT